MIFISLKGLRWRVSPGTVNGNEPKAYQLFPNSLPHPITTPSCGSYWMGLIIRNFITRLFEILMNTPLIFLICESFDMIKMTIYSATWKDLIMNYFFIALRDFAAILMSSCLVSAFAFPVILDLFQSAMFDI